VFALQVEAVENHMPEIVIVDEIGTEAEALACRTIAERGVQLIATAHGQLLENLLKNPTLSDLVGGIQSVTLGASACVHWDGDHVYHLLLFTVPSHALAVFPREV
jgi:stage III sporulation protein SpoIIIAA